MEQITIQSASWSAIICLAGSCSATNFYEFVKVEYTV